MVAIVMDPFRQEIGDGQPAHLRVTAGSGQVLGAERLDQGGARLAEPGPLRQERGEIAAKQRLTAKVMFRFFSMVMAWPRTPAPVVSTSTIACASSTNQRTGAGDGVINRSTSSKNRVALAK